MNSGNSGNSGGAMADAQRPKVETRLVRRKLSELRLLGKNARYMTAAQFDRLTKNLERDGALTSAPLLYRGEVLSGNHRVKAAMAAGILEADCIEITSELSEQQRTAIVLSHNAVTGQDDMSILRDLYDSLGLDEKLYSGLSDETFSLPELDVSALSIGAVKYEELNVLFLPAEKSVFLEALKRIEKQGRTDPVLTARLEDFDTVFSAVTAAKKRLNIYNTAIALRVMAELAMKALPEEEPKKPTGSAS